MPIFDYQCKECEVIVEKMCKDSDPPPVCEKCGKDMERLVGAPSFRLYGDGWYKRTHKDTGDFA